jgi:hypothetical protein
MRKSCLCCVKKHIAKAIILFAEAELGYPLHFWLGLANLSEAEDECVRDYPDLARRIRKARIEIEVGQFKGDLLDFIQEVLEIERKNERIKSEPF